MECYTLGLAAQPIFNSPSGLVIQPIHSWLSDESSRVSNLTKGTSTSPHSHNQSFHCRTQSEWLFLITSLFCLSLEMGSKRRSCTMIFTGTEVSQQLTVFQNIFSAILEYDCNVCFFHSSQFFTDNTQEPCNHSSQQANYSSQLFQHLWVSLRNMNKFSWSSFQLVHPVLAPPQTVLVLAGIREKVLLVISKVKKAPSTSAFST